MTASTPLRRHSGPWRTRVSALGLLLVAATGCSGDEDAPQAVGTEATSLQNVVPGAVVAGPVSGYVVDRSDPKQARLYVIGESEPTVEDFPTLTGMAATFFADQLVVGGVRCADESCETTVAEFVFAEADGSVRTVVEADEHPGAPESGDALVIIGSTDDTLWALGLRGQLLEIASDGKIVEHSTVQGEPCLIDDRLFTLAENASADEGVPHIDASEETAKRFEVLELVGAVSRPVPDGTLDYEGPLAYGFCADNSFEIGNSARTHAWTAKAGWTDINVDASAKSQATSSTHRSFYLADDGSLMRRAGEQDEPTGIEFSSATADSKDQAPPALFVDDSGGGLLACIGTSASTFSCQYRSA